MDFNLKLEINGTPVTADEYLEYVLRLKPDVSKRNIEHNRPRERITSFFPKRKCFVMNPAFKKHTRTFVDYIYMKAQTKRDTQGREVTGKMLAPMVTTYVTMICSGRVPCLENAVTTMSKIENTAAVREALDFYKEAMNEVKPPIQSVDALFTVHERCRSEALQVFLKRSFKDEGDKYQAELERNMATLYEMFQKNFELSERDLLELLEPIEKRMRGAACDRPGGYAEFENDKDALISKYHKNPGKGLQAKDTHQEFPKNKEQHQIVQQTSITLSGKETALRAEPKKPELMKEAREEESIAHQQLTAE
uniref:Guanylate-binding protein/Atlastin C-terminal domain-containing protein n=1 Tax=Callorhinchus milii TaxID=7868 RepID=A0A4W3HQW8_CALMI